MKTTKVLFYCTKSKNKLWYEPILGKWLTGIERTDKKNFAVNGKIVAECEVETEKIVLSQKGNFYTPTLNTKELLEKSCLTKEQLSEYLNNKGGYALHIKNLKIVHSPIGSVYASGLKMIDRNKENTRAVIERFKNKNFVAFKYIEKAPQNMCFVFRLNQNEEYYDNYVLISIRPEWLCKILNGEKTIEVRKQVLKVMLYDYYSENGKLKYFK